MSRLAVPTTVAVQAQRTESRLRELDRKSAGAAAGVENLIASARQTWHGDGLLEPNGVLTNLTDWETDVDDEVVTFTGGALVLTQPGRWALWLQMGSDCGASGNSIVMLAAESAAVSPWGIFPELKDERLRGSGYANAGNLCQSVSWSGVVTPEQAMSPLRPRAAWRSSTGANAAIAEWWLSAHYLGAARLPE